MKKNLKKGFTVIEVILVIGILAALSAILIPSFANYIDNANIAVDKSNLRILNGATSLYKLTQSHQGDVFEGIDTDLNRQNKLIEENYMRQIVAPKKDGNSFYWSVGEQIWKYSERVVSIETTSSLIFKDLPLSEYRKTGTWTKNQEGFVSGGGILFIPNPAKEYTVSSKARLPIGESGGYGLLVETSLTENNRDSGYSIQLDRRLGGVVIRKRTDTRESNTITSVTHRNNPLIPQSKSDEWWTQEHTMKVDVKASSNPNKKIINVYINDEIVIANFEIDENPNPDTNFAGLRSWNGAVTYKDLEITK